MKLLLFEWNAYMQEDLEEILKKLDVSFEIFSYEFVYDGLYEDKYLERNFADILLAGAFDGVMSLNYWPPIARVCYQASCPYIAWVYDCPIAVNELEKTLRYPTNHLFLFDREQYRSYKEAGFNTVWHMPLGVNVDRLDKIKLTKEEKNELAADVSFVGSMYPSDYMKVKNDLTENESGYLEGLIETQYRIYGYFYIKKFLRTDFLKPIQKRLENAGLNKSNGKLFQGWMLQLLSREITRRERFMIIQPLSSRCKFNLYSPHQEKLLTHVNFMGTVDSYNRLPRVFKSSKINLNITFKQITSGMPLRVLDIMGAGGFLLSNYQEELAENFRPGIDCVIYESVEDAVLKAQYYLRHEDERMEIARNGHETVKKFAYENQLKKILETTFSEKRF